jgi:hypothetical protein
VTRIALGHHGGGLEGRVGDLSNGELLVVRLLSRDDRRIRGKHEMDTWVGHQVSLELSNIDVEGTIESERGSQRGDDLGEKSVQVGVSGPLDIEVSSADVVDGLVVEHDSDISVLEKRVSGEHGVVGLNDGSGNLRRWVDSEAELGFLAVIDGKSLEEERAESGASATTDSVEDEEPLEASALIGELSDSVKAEIDDFFTNGVMSTGEVVSGVLLARDELLRMEELSVGASSDLIDDGGLEIEEKAARNVFASTSLREEGVESVITTANSLVGWHLSVRLDSVLKAEELPASVSGLDTGLANVDSNALTHLE